MATKFGNPRAIQNGLILDLFSFNADNTSSTWKDQSGNGWDFSTINGASYSNGVYSFDGVNDYIISSTSSSVTDNLHWTPDGSVGNSSMTIEIWIKTTDSNGYVFSHPWNGSGQYNLYILPQGGFGIHVASGSTPLSSPPDGVINNGQWRCMVAWVDTTNMAFYYDGKYYSSKAHGLTGGVPSAGNSTGMPLDLMTIYPYGTSWSGNTSYSINGDLAVVRIYNRVLSDSEILENYNRFKKIFR